MVELVETIREVTSAKVEYNLIEYPIAIQRTSLCAEAPISRKARLQLDFKPVDLKGVKAVLPMVRPNLHRTVVADRKKL